MPINIPNSTQDYKRFHLPNLLYKQQSALTSTSALQARKGSSLSLPLHLPIRDKVLHQQEH